MNHADVLALLPDLLHDRLEEDAAESARSHLAGCADCSTAMETLEMLTGTGETAHPISSEVVAFAVRPDSLDKDVRGRLETHLRACPSCAEEATATRDADRAAMANERQGAGTVPFRKRSSWRSAWPGLAAAAALTLLLGYPASLGLFRLPRVAEERDALQRSEADRNREVEALRQRLAAMAASPQAAKAWGGVVIPVPLSSTTRGAGDSLPQVASREDQPIVFLAVSFLLSVAPEVGGTVVIEIRPKGVDRVVFSRGIPRAQAADALSAAGSVALLVPSRVLEPGEFEAKVLWSDKGEPQILAAIPFRVVREPGEKASPDPVVAPK